MFHRLLVMASGLALVPLLIMCTTQGADLKGKEVVPSKAVKPVPKPPVLEESGCGKHGTTVEFEDTPSDAAKKALKEQKLVFVLHVSGHFEDPGIT